MKRNITAGAKSWNKRSQRVAKQGTHIVACVVLGMMIFAVVRTAQAQPGDGATVYLQNCATCHGPDATGAMPGIPDLTASRAWLQQDNSTLVKRIQQGIQSPGAPMAMPPNGGNPELSPAQLEAAVRHLKSIVENQSVD